MKLILAVAAATTALSVPRGSVTGVSVVPTTGATTGRADVVIAVDNTVDVRDFTMADPARIVLDLSGATLGLSPSYYDRVPRGGVTNVRFSQYRLGVVRVVVNLDGPHKYTVAHEAHDVRVTIDGDGDAVFSAWHWGTNKTTLASAAAAADVTATDADSDPTPVAPTVPSAAVLTSESGALATPGTSRSTVELKPQQSLLQQKQSTQPRITVTYQDADIRDVLAAFAAFSGRTIVVGREVQGTITAEIRDQPWDVALQSILDAQQLAATEDQYGIITVDSYKNIQAKQASEPLETQVVPVNYANAASLVLTVKSLLAHDCSLGGGAVGATPGAAPVTSNTCPVRGNVVADTATNTLLITEAKSHIQSVLNYVRALDIRTPQVSIRAKIIFINRTEFTQLGLAYDLGAPAQFFNQLVQRTNPTTGQPYIPTVNVVDLGGNTLAGISNASRPYQAGAALNLLYTLAIGKFSLSTFLDATQGLQLSDVQAEPSVVTLDNRVANIQVGEETPIRVIDANSAAGGPAQATVTFKETGIILNVTPHITRNGQVLMTVHAEQSQLQQVGGDLGFNFFKRAADTKLLVNDGETAVIGGLTETQVNKTRNSIPILGELPLIGSLFSQTQNQKIKQDLLILITPHVIGDGIALDSAAAK
jgi:type IV pilus assembly protein PilQ